MNSSARSVVSSFQPVDIIAARKELARRHLADFACMVDIPTAPISDAEDEDNFSVIRLNSLVKHHGLLCSKLEMLGTPAVPNLMVLMPPGSAKSTYVDVVFVPWWMAKKPRRNVILASYAKDIAMKQGRRARQLINSRSFQNLFGVTLKKDQTAAHQWALTNGSEYMAGGLRGALTGNRGALGIVDDPVKNREEAQNEDIQDKIWDGYIDDFCSRLIPGSPQVIIQTRWVEYDLGGRILPEKWDGESGLMKGRDGRMWYVLCMPAICDRHDDPLGRKIGETLWPEWFSLEHWLPFQQNRRTWVSLYQQKPTDAEGTMFKREWFKRYTPDMLPSRLHKYITSDHAPSGGGEDGEGDYNCFRIWGIDPHDNIYLLDGFRTQETIDLAMDRIVGNKEERLIGMIQKHKPLAWFPEDDNNWKSVAGYVKRQMRREQQYIVLHPISPHGEDKIVKAQALQGLVSSGFVYIPVGPEGDDIIDQYVKFPGAKHDDEVDAGSILGRAVSSAHPAIIPHEKDTSIKFPVQQTFNELVAQRTRERRERE